MLKQKLRWTPNTNSKLFRLAVSALLVAGTALGANVIGAIAFTNPHWVYSNRAFAQDVGEKVYQQASDAVVTIKVSDDNGSGSIISSDGLVLTCAHVVSDART
jgi:S1-C subfamily serine protease